MTQNTIGGEQTVLRPTAGSDLDLLVDWLQDPEVYRWWGGEPVSREAVAAKYTGARRPIVDSFLVEHDGKPVGYIQAHLDDDGSAGLDMFLVSAARGRGLGPDAARALAEHVRQVRGWRRLTVDPAASNTQAIRAWRRAGFRFERELPDAPGGPGLLLVYGPQRIHIVGGPGSGKTTLAGQLSACLAVPAYDLDAVAYAGGAGAQQSLEVRRQEVERIAQMPGWVSEGIYLWWCKPLAERADRIVWLDVSWPVAVYRIVRRHCLLSLAGTNRHSGLKKLVRFVWGTRRYYSTGSSIARPDLDANDDGAITRAATAAWLTSYADKVIRRGAVGDLEPLLAQTDASS